MIRTILTGLCLALLPSLATAQVVEECDWRARADAIPEPWEDHTRTFANGEVRIALLDVIEPAAGAFHILLIHPPYGALGEKTCTIVSFSENVGYAGVFFEELEADYDPAQGLIFRIPAILYLPEEGFQNSLIANIVLNQATGAVTVTHELGSE